MRRSRSTACLQSICLLGNTQANATETDLHFRYQNYKEEDGRIEVDAAYFLLRQTMDTGFSFGIEYAYDSLSGATPVGTYDPDDPNIWEYQEIEDIRRAFVFDVEQDFGDYSLTLEASRSEESDYISEGLALRGSLDLFEKNTVVTAGLAISSDTILSNQATSILTDRHKHTFDLGLGLTQIIDKNTYLNFNLGYGESSGYLSDPYRRISETDTFTIGGITFVDTISHPENRPNWQCRFTARIAATHYIEPLHAACEASYRFYATSDSLEAHTFELRWIQEVTESFSLTTFFRYYVQSKADFYYPSLTGTPIDGTGDTFGYPPNYSSDYRLAALGSLSYGLQLTYEPTETFSIDLQLERYEMYGRGSGTPSQFFPTANIISLGASLHF